MSWRTSLIVCAILFSTETFVFGQSSPEPAPTPASLTAAGRSQAYIPMTAEERLRLFASRTFGPAYVARRLATAGYQTWRDIPREWDDDARGFSQRAGTRLARGGVNHTVEMGVGFLLQDDPRYYPSEKAGFGPRARHAVTSAFVVRNATGGRMPAYSRFAGVISSNFVINTWLPPSNNGWEDALRRSGIELSSQAGWNLLREFWPDIRRKLGR